MLPIETTVGFSFDSFCNAWRTASLAVALVPCLVAAVAASVGTEPFELYGHTASSVVMSELVACEPGDAGS